jgi:hypothetical protein
MAIDVKFETMGAGTCCWCGAAKDEVLTLSFSDRSFGGPMCFNDLKKALRMKLVGGRNANGVPTPTPVASGAGTSK